MENKKNVYLIKSTSYHLLNEEIKKIALSCDSVDMFSLNDVTIYDVLDDASYFGLFASKRAIVIRDVKYFGGKFLYEEESSAIINFISKMDDELVLIFVCDDIKKSKDLTKKIIDLGAEVIELNSNSDKEVLELVEKYIKDNEIIIDSKAQELIIKNGLNNIDIIIQEINKLSLVDKHITENIVKEYGSVEEDDYTFDFSNAVVAKDFDKAFMYLDKLIAKDIDGYTLIGLLASSFTNMYMVKSAASDGLSDEEIAKLFGYSGTGRVYVLKKNSKIYTLDELKDIIINLSNIDIKIKTGANPVYEIKNFLLNL